MANGPSVEIRDFQTRFGEWTVAFRWQIIAATLVLVGAAASGVLLLESSTDYRAFFSEDNPELQAFEALENTYEKSDNVLFMIVPDDRDATSEQALAAAVWLTGRAWLAPYSTRVDSIANFPHMTADGDDLSVRDLVDPAKLGDADERRRIRATALEDPRLAGNLVAQDGGVSAVNVTVKLPEEGNAAGIAEIAGFARSLAAEAGERFPGVDFRLVGTVIVNQAFTEASVATMGTVLPASLAVMALILGFLTRGFAGVAATGGVIVFSVLAAMGLSGWVGIPFSTSTSATPIIVLTLAVANCVHVLVTAQERLGAGDPKRAAVVESIRVNLHPIFLASATTAFGFLTLNFSEVPPYRHLGTLVAIGAGVSFALSITFLPALLSLLPMRARRPGRSRMGIEVIAELAVRRRTVLLWGGDGSSSWVCRQPSRATN